METTVFAFLMESPLWTFYKQEKKSYLGLTTGRYNGYVGFEGTLPQSRQGGADYEDDNALDNQITVHGGITFDGKFSKKSGLIPLTNIPEDWYKYRIVGFDCAHWNDTEENCSFEFTKEETLSLLKQIKELINK